MGDGSLRPGMLGHLLTCLCERCCGYRIGQKHAAIDHERKMNTIVDLADSIRSDVEEGRKVIGCHKDEPLVAGCRRAVKREQDFRDALVSVVSYLPLSVRERIGLLMLADGSEN